MRERPWLLFALVTALLWGVWGALIEIPQSAGFPDTLNYAVWALTMIPCALVALGLNRWRFERDGRSILLGLVIGLTGAGGQLVLFKALQSGPAYIIFPLVALSPVITIVLSVLLLNETAPRRQWVGIALALPAIVLVSFQPPDAPVRGYLWLALALFVFFAWGLQAYVMKLANGVMAAEAIFFYMMLAGLLLVPAALSMTDFGRPINWGPSGPWAAAAIQVLNSIGALTIVYAFRYGKAIVVAPIVNALPPAITILLSLAIHQRLPHEVQAVGIVIALVSVVLLAE